MGLFSRRRPAPPTTLDIALFPLQTVLFPGGLLGLKLFEQRYLDMAAACLRTNEPFGVCLIATGKEVGAAAEPHAVGTLARIVDCEVPQLGIMQVQVLGEQRFRILASRAASDQLLRGQVEILPQAKPVPLSATGERLLPLLRRIVADLGEARIAPPHRYGDADWVGCRLCEVLPVQNLAKQKLLELDDPLTRLEILEKYLAQRGLV